MFVLFQRLNIHMLRSTDMHSGASIYHIFQYIFILNLTFTYPCLANIFAAYNKQDATFHNLFISVTITNAWKVLKCGAGEGWRRSVGLIM